MVLCFKNRFLARFPCRVVKSSPEWRAGHSGRDSCLADSALRVKISPIEKSKKVFFYRFRSFDVDSKSMHELKRLFIVLIQNFISLQIVFVIVGENGFHSGICLHPFVLLDLFDSVTLVWVFDKHVSDQVFAFCGGNEILRLTLSKLNIKFAAAVNLIKLDTPRN